MPHLSTTKPLALMPIAISAMLLIVGCSGNEDKQGPKPVNVLVQKAGGSNASLTTNTFSGTIESRHQTPVSFRVSGMVVAKHINVGDRVQKGQLLAQIDNTDYKLAQAAAVQQVQAIQSNLGQVEADERRLQALVGDNTVSLSEYERLRSSGNALRAQLKQAQQQVSLQGNQLQYTALYAPHSGVVSALYIEQGQNVGQGMPALVLSAEDGLEVALDIPQSAASSPAVKSASTVINGQTYDLQLRHLSPMVTPRTQSVSVRYKVLNAPSNLTLGATVAVKINGINAADPLGANNTVVLPASSVVKLQKQAFVWVVPQATNNKGSKLIMRPVQIVQYSTDGVQVQGVQQGEYVVSVGAFKLTSDLHVLAYDRATLVPIATAASN